MYQKHDALEDAKMLKTVVKELYNKCTPEDLAHIQAIPSQEKPKVANGKKAPTIFVMWNDYSRWTAPTNADASNYAIKYTEQNSGKTKYFPDLDTATLWAIKYLTTNISPKNEKAVSKTRNTIKDALEAKKTKVCRFNGYWERNENK